MLGKRRKRNVSSQIVHFERHAPASKIFNPHSDFFGTRRTSPPPQPKHFTRPIRVGRTLIGGGESITFIGGPNYVESPEQMLTSARLLSEIGIHFIRARAFRQDAWGNEFQGLGLAGLKILRAAADKYGLYVISEVIEPGDVKALVKYCDIVEVGPRNAHNHELLHELARHSTTVILHRGSLMTIGDMMSALRVLENGKRCRIILAENGIRAFDPRLKNLLDLSSLVDLRQHTAYPVFLDCSAAASQAKYVESLALAAVAVGVDGLLVEVHPLPEEAYVESKRALAPQAFAHLMKQINAVKSTLNAIRNSNNEDVRGELSDEVKASLPSRSKLANYS